MFRCFKMVHFKPTVIESIVELELPVRTSLFLMSNLGLIALRIFDLCGLIVKEQGEGGKLKEERRKGGRGGPEGGPRKEGSKREKLEAVYICSFVILHLSFSDCIKSPRSENKLIYYSFTGCFYF